MSPSWDGKQMIAHGFGKTVESSPVHGSPTVHGQLYIDLGDGSLGFREYAALLDKEVDLLHSSMLSEMAERLDEMEQEKEEKEKYAWRSRPCRICGEISWSLISETMVMCARCSYPKSKILSDY